MFESRHRVCADVMPVKSTRLVELAFVVSFVSLTSDCCTRLIWRDGTRSKGKRNNDIQSEQGHNSIATCVHGNRN